MSGQGGLLPCGLPLEVFSLILALLPFSERVHCLDVSRVWRRAMLQCATLWRDLDLAPTPTTPSCLPILRGLDMVLAHTRNAPWPKRLCIVHYATWDSERVLQALDTHGCRSLLVLELTQNKAPRHILLCTLQTIGAHLTHLRLDQPNISLKTIFGPICQACPHLTHLSARCCHRFSTLHFCRSAPALKLVHLDLSMLHWRYLARDMLATLLPRLPHLQHFVFYGCTVIDLQHLLHQLFTWCPRFKWIYYDPCLRCYAPTSSPWLLSRDSRSPVKHQAANELVIRNDVVRHSDLDRMIQASHADLQTLRLSHNLMLIDPVLLTLATLGAPHLRELELSVNDVSEGALVAVIHAAQSTLESVALQYLDEVSDRVLHILATLPRLRCLNLSECRRITGAGIRHLVDKTPARLEKIVLVYRGISAIDIDTYRYMQTKRVTTIW